MSWWMLLLLLPAVVSAGREDHIINGKNVESPGKYPWQGSLQFLGSHSCGCSLISPEWAITASHCIISLSPSVYTVIFGAHDIHTLGQGDPRAYPVRKIIMHENYGSGSGNFPNDIALLRFELNKPVEYNDYTQPIRLPDVSQDFVGNTDCVITGWGYTSGMGGSVPNILQEADTMVITLETCQDLWGSTKVTTGHICLLNNVNSGCMGDSGGPLVCKENDGLYTLAGLTSWGSSTCKVNYPSVYTDIVYFRQWIKDNTGL